MLQFPSSENEWRLDVVSILAVLGESNIKLNSHLITGSKLCLLPRLMPAPQALLAEKRLPRLPYEEDVHVYAISSRQKRLGLNYFPYLIHGSGEQEAAFTVRTIHITRKSEVPTRIRPYNFVNTVTVFSFLLSIGLLVWAILLHDGIGTIGIIVMSVTSPMLCLPTRWKFPKRSAPRHERRFIPPETIVIRSRSGVFTIVRTDLQTSRDLYFGAEDFEYTMTTYTGRGLGGVVGGLTLMGAVVMFGNCSWTMQAAIAVSYALLNALYWLATVIPEKYYWNMDMYTVELEDKTDHRTFTASVYSAIGVTNSIDWVKQTEAVPQTRAWDQWLDEAVDAVRTQDMAWHPQARLAELLVMEHEVKRADVTVVPISV